MSDVLDLAAFADDLTPTEREALGRAVAADSGLANAIRRWRGVRGAVASDLQRSFADGELLSLLALEETAPDALEESDRARLAAARPALDRALTEYPSLVSLVRRLGADAAAFDAAWEAHELAPDYSRVSTTARVHAMDRAPARRTNVTLLWRSVGRMAAVFALIALGAIAALLLRRDAGLTRIVAEGPMTVDMPDGSAVELAAGAELWIPEAPAADPEAVSGDTPDGARRYARLATGRALFRVARSSEPFVVETPSATVTVLGTTFGVTAAGSDTDVVLLDGAVEVSARAGGPAVRLAPGQASRVEGQAGPTPAARANVDEALAWTGDVFLRAEPLAAAVSRLGAAFGVSVTVDSSIASEAVSGRFDIAEGVDSALRALALAIDGRVERDETGYRIVPAD